VAALVAVAARLALAMLPGLIWLLHIGATAWIIACTTFAIAYLPLLAGARRR
jgi:hypothetical protein